MQGLSRDAIDRGFILVFLFSFLFAELRGFRVSAKGFFGIWMLLEHVHVASSFFGPDVGPLESFCSCFGVSQPRRMDGDPGLLLIICFHVGQLEALFFTMKYTLINP